ncbi:MAG: hypothetical protein A3C61_02060 [Candidatus Yanofskybacteria bacterium RIFCSPHIGHO2_02_FULL_39_10]|uniref:Uncharacterized protein n=1 Tax=Candidatus Yanofskybacteria bacterium RIFCSPHIGHO2_02_FULL_39_10 TaxID=1802674 RepID=A0A1F8F4D3_9BACT|nr:MAG: hypothetical protein A3C61_02060 [Candidatus Yanofskybacteria bacterium RIFCSPHIGHO2_02_FULL_39_10]
MFVSAKAAPRDLSGPNWILVSRMLIENINYALLVAFGEVLEEDDVKEVADDADNEDELEDDDTEEDTKEDEEEEFPPLENSDWES